MIKQAYPLSWPLGWRRTAVRRRSRFGTYNKKPTVAAAVDELMPDLGARAYVEISPMEQP